MNKSQSSIVSLLKDRASCKGCGLASLCLPVGLNDGDVDRLNSIVTRNTPYHRGDMLYTQGDTFSQIYIVKSGSVKAYYEDKDGNEHVVGFFLPGELIGLEAIHTGVHSCSAAVLETTAACEVPFEDLEQLSSELPSLQHQLLRLLSREVHNDCGMVALLGNNSAEERVAAFLISLSTRFHQRGLSANEFYLSMSRAEIASFLGLAVETVSRTFSRFQEKGLLEAERKSIKILEIEALNEIGGLCASTAFQLGQRQA
ncbi:MAG: fumarate/nitrate reduction transcriptional regulator Fnr [Gammaproteobacteria bacterium]|jgi:CRP/FNR family transcriptional regulator, anaerobic regulatory protein